MAPSVKASHKETGSRKYPPEEEKMNLVKKEAFTMNFRKFSCSTVK